MSGNILLPVFAASPGSPSPGLLYTPDNRPYLTFDSALEEECLWAFDMPDDYASGLTANVTFSCAVGSGNFWPSVEIMSVADGANIINDAWGVDNDAPETAVPATPGNKLQISWLLPNDGAPSPVAPLNYVAIRFHRKTTGTPAAGDVYVWSASLTYTPTA